MALALVDVVRGSGEYGRPSPIGYATLAVAGVFFRGGHCRRVSTRLEHPLLYVLPP